MKPLLFHLQFDRENEKSSAKAVAKLVKDYELRALLPPPDVAGWVAAAVRDGRDAHAVRTWAVEAVGADGVKQPEFLQVGCFRACFWGVVSFSLCQFWGEVK